MRNILTTIALLASLALATGCQSTDNQTTKSVDPTAMENLSGPVNANCPLMVDHEIDPEVTVEWNGHTVAFCCSGCIDDFNDMTEEQQRGALMAAGAELD